MDTKKCNKCLLVLPVSDFGIEARAKNGYKPRCKKCTNDYYREFYATSYREKKIEIEKQKYRDNTEQKVQQSKLRYQKNKDKVSEYNKKYKSKNRVQLNAKACEYISKRKKIDPVFRAQLIMRKFVHRILKNKTNRTNKLLKYGAHDLINHIGRIPNSDENIDHKIPITWFVEDTPVHIVCHLENLHILNASENFKKHNTYSHTVSAEYYSMCIRYIKPENQNKVTHHDN
jgi:actin-related protein